MVRSEGLQTLSGRVRSGPFRVGPGRVVLGGFQNLTGSGETTLTQSDPIREALTYPVNSPNDTQSFSHVIPENIKKQKKK